jgi:hypothetical protein
MSDDEEFRERAIKALAERGIHNPMPYELAKEIVSQKDAASTVIRASQISRAPTPIKPLSGSGSSGYWLDKRAAEHSAPKGERTLREEIEHAHAQTETAKSPTTKPVEHQPLPSHEEIPTGFFALFIAILWAVIAFAFGFEVVVTFNDWLLRGDKAAIAVAGMDIVLCFAFAAIALVLWKRRDWLPERFAQTAIAVATNAYAWVAVSLVTLVVLSLPHLIGVVRISAPTANANDRAANQQAIPSTSPPPVAPLSEDEKQFRHDLRIFVAFDLEAQKDDISAVINPLVNTADRNDQNQNAVYELFTPYYAHFLDVSWKNLEGWVNGVPIDAMDMSKISGYLRDYLGDYSLMQRQLHDFIVLYQKAPDPSRISKWLYDDQKAADAFRGLKSSPSAQRMGFTQMVYPLAQDVFAKYAAPGAAR